MPNWCEGNIRFRGAQKNIRRFLTNEIVCCRYENHETVEERPIIQDKDYLLIIRKPDEHGWFWIRNTHRNFLDGDMLEIWLDEEDPDRETIVCIEGFKAAWGFERHDGWPEHARKYEMDVKMTGYDCGMLFSHVKTISRDGTVKETICEYENSADWMWNCPRPNNGG